MTTDNTNEIKSPMIECMNSLTNDKNGCTHEEVYQLLCKLAGVFGKELTQEEQREMLYERYNKWIKDPNCFNK